MPLEKKELNLVPRLSYLSLKTKSSNSSSGEHECISGHSVEIAVEIFSIPNKNVIRLEMPDKNSVEEWVRYHPLRTMSIYKLIWEADIKILTAMKARLKLKWLERKAGEWSSCVSRPVWLLYTVVWEVRLLKAEIKISSPLFMNWNRKFREIDIRTWIIRSSVKRLLVLLLPQETTESRSKASSPHEDLVSPIP